jgi:hypothetical protein
MRRIVTTDKKGKKKLVNVPSWDLVYVNNQFGQPAYDVGVFSNGSGSAESTSSNNAIYDALSAAGQTAFNAATVGNFFSVSAADYASVFANVTGTTKYAMTDAQLAETNDAWSGNYAYTIDQSTSQIPASSYVIGFAARASSVSSGTVTPLISTTYRGSYSAISNSPTFAAGSPSAIQYYIRKNPTTGTAAISYLALVATTNRLRGTTTYGGAFAVSPYNSWTNYPGAAGPVQQFLSTTTKSW